MDNLKLVQVFQSIQCRFKEHQNNNRVNRICIDKDCEISRLVCDLCGEMHKSHRAQLLTVAELQDALRKLSKSDEAVNNIKRFEQMIEDFYRQSKTKLKALIEDLQQLLDVSNLMKSSFLEDKVNSYEQLDKQMKQLLKFVELINGDIKFKILKPSDLYPQMNHRLAQYLQDINDFWRKNTGYGNQQLVPVSIEQNQVQQLAQLPIQQLSQQQQIPQIPPPQHQPQPRLLQNETFNPSLQDQLENQTPQQIHQISLQEQLDSLQFSQEFSSQQIECISPKCVKKIGIKNTNDVACLNQPLSLYEKKSFVFRIKTLKSYIGIGISIFQSVQANDFIFGDQRKLGHGVFMVLNNGLVYNNSYSEFNEIIGSLELKQNEKYRLIFDPWNEEGQQFVIQQLADNQDQKIKSYAMPILIDEDLDYHPFVFLGQKDGEVELLNEE